jgi:F-type H+/Na+-transporting ATPase subunit alpha
MTYVLRQPQYQPMAVEHQVAILYVGVNGYLNDVPLDKVGAWETGFHQYMDAQGSAIMQAIRDTKALSPELEAQLKQAIIDYKKIA